MAWGPWAFSDSAGYISAARNLVAGDGIGVFDPTGRFRPLASHPPLYVLALGAVSSVGLEPLDAARVLDLLFFGLLVGVSGQLISRLLECLWAGFAYSTLLMLHPALIIAYTSAMAEPPFILLGLLCLLFLTDYLLRPRPAAFLSAALCAGGALLSRYPGAVYVLTGAAAIVLWGGSQGAARLRRAAAFTVIGGLPVGSFLIWSASLPGTEGPRALAPGSSPLAGMLRFLRLAGETVWSWKPIPPVALLPGWLTELAPPALIPRIVTAIGLLAGLLMIYRSLFGLPDPAGVLRATPAGILIRVLGLFTTAYLAFFLAAYLATDPTPDVDSRTLLPMLPALLAMVVALVRLTWAAWNRKPVLWAGWIALALASLSGYAVISQDILMGLHRTGLGYTGREWRSSPTIAAIRQMPPGQVLISNEPYAVLLLTDRTAYSIFEIAQNSPVAEFAAFGGGSTEAEQAFRTGEARLVLFDTIREQFETLYGGRSDERYESFVRGLTRELQTEDGVVLRYPTGVDPP
jgi:hypothetical protein